MSWLSVVSSLFRPVEQSSELERREPKPSPARKKQSAKVSVGVGVHLDKAGRTRATAKGGVAVRSGPVTSTVLVKVSDKGKLSARVGQGVTFSVGGHQIRLGASVGSGGDLKSNVSWSSSLPRAGADR